MALNEKNGELSIKIEKDPESYLAKMRSIIRLTQNQKELNEEDQYFALELLDEMLPDVPQIRKILETR